MRSTEKFISIVQKYPTLYDQSHSEYKNVRAKDKIWMEIGKEFNDSGEELKKKWKNLRDTYAKYIRSMKTRTGRSAPKTKPWVWAHHMEAFRPFLPFAKTTSKANEITSVSGTSESITGGVDDNFEIQSTQLHTENNSVDDTHPSVTNSSQSSHSIPTLLEQTDVATITPPKVPTKEKKEKRVPQSLSSIGDLMKYFKNKKKFEHDAVDSLMLAHAKTIKTFSGRRQIMTKIKIAQVIMEQELLHQEELISSIKHNNALSRPRHSCDQDCSTSNTSSSCPSIVRVNDSRASEANFLIFDPYV